MSVIHLNQIKKFLEERYFEHIALNENESKLGVEDKVYLKYSKSLVALTISMIGSQDPKEASKYITDGFGDEGIDGIFYNEEDKTLYLIQSKFHANGSGSISKGDSLKFLNGIRLLVKPDFNSFNATIKKRKNEIESYLLDSQTKFSLIVVHTGTQNISPEVEEDFSRFLIEHNDPTEIVSFQVFSQKDIHQFISRGLAGTPINIDIALFNWGDIKEPQQSFYGQIAANELAIWYDKHGRLLFTPNIRVFLGDTSVNQGIIETLSSSPELFWYFNNGVTVLCDTIEKKPLGGSTRETGFFLLKNAKIVNGAQTVGSIYSAYKKEPAKVEQAKVQIRIISLENSSENLGKTITRTNNTQNRIESRDFVSLDIHQKRIFDELIIDNIHYLYKSGETRDVERNGFDLVEATIARACIQEDIQFAVQAKREIGKLWENIEKAPYKILFNGSVHGPDLWRQVEIMRVVEKYISNVKSSVSERELLLITHGNRFLLHLILNKIDKAVFDTSKSFDETLVLEAAEKFHLILLKTTNELYPDSVLGTLFKNLDKCRRIKERITEIDL